MHWSVGMLLHAVCVFFYKGEKRDILENWPRGCFPNTFSCQHGAVDLDYIPYVSAFDFMLENVLHVPPALMWSRCWGTDLSVLVLLCHHHAFVTRYCFFPPIGPSNTGLYLTRFVFFFGHIHDIASYLGLGFCAYYFWNHPLSWITCSSVLLAIALCGLFGKYLTRLLEPLVLLSKLLYCGYTII